MKPISLAVVVALLAAGLTAGCAATGTTPTDTRAGNPYQANQGALGLKAEDDPANTAGNPFRFAALILYPVGLILQGVFEVPYLAASAINPDLFNINETEQQYLQMRWGLQPPPKPEAQPAAAK